jgi:hypothetical protein
MVAISGHCWKQNNLNDSLHGLFCVLRPPI